jgi:hypothetical protein
VAIILFEAVRIVVSILFAALAIGTLAAVHFGIMIQILRSPSFSFGVSAVVVSITLLADVMMFLNFYRKRGLFPFVSDEWAQVLAKLQYRDPQMYEGIMKIARREYEVKGVLRRLLTRPNPIRVYRRVYRQVIRKKVIESLGRDAAKWVRGR